VVSSCVILELDEYCILWESAFSLGVFGWTDEEGAPSVYEWVEASVEQRDVADNGMCSCRSHVEATYRLVLERIRLPAHKSGKRTLLEFLN
jgi:hypothetical protein